MIRLITCGVVSCLIFMSSVASAQRREDGRLSLQLVLDMVSLGGGHRYYEPDDFEFLLSAWVERPTGVLLIDQARLRAAFRARVQTGQREVPVTLHWLDEVEHPDSSRSFSGAPITLEPSRGSTIWRFRIVPDGGGKFDFGRYQVSIDVSNLRSAVRTLDGRPFEGVLWEDGIHVRRVVVEEPGNQQDIAAMHVLAAALARKRGDKQGEIDAYIRAAAVRGGGGYQLKIANLYALDGRHAEAISVYEAIAARSGLRRDSQLREFLARSYLALGDTANARRVLLQSGETFDTVGSKMQLLRERLDNR